IYKDGKVQDIEAVPGSRKKIIAVLYGIRFSINLDWYVISMLILAATGGCYLAIKNLHRSVRLLPHNVILAFTIPGPKEPDFEELNHVLHPVVDEFRKLYCGVVMSIYEKQLPREIFALAFNETSDLPASRKLAGTAAHSHKTHPCPCCNITHDDINTACGYDIEKFDLKDDFAALQHAYESRDASTKKKRKEILDDYGVQWSVLNLLACWLPILCAPVDFMHNMFLGIIAHFFCFVIIGGYMLSKAQRNIYEEFMESVEWPSSIGRLPKNLADNPKLKKADEWRRVAAIWPVVFFVMWRTNDDDISATAASIPANAKSRPTFTRSNIQIYQALLRLCAAARILSSRAISVDTARWGISLLQQYCRLLLSLRVPLMPNHHVAMHYLTFFKLFGPVYGWWLFAFERFNGMLEKIKTNNRSDGGMEITLMRHWVRYHRLYELSLPLYPNYCPASPLEYPKQGEACNLCNMRGLELYSVLLQYVRTTWPELTVCNDYEVGHHIFSATTSATFFPWVRKAGIRYGSKLATRTQADGSAFVLIENNIVPCQLIGHFTVTISGTDKCENCSVIRRFFADDQIPRMPWDLHALDLGMYTAYANKFHDYEVVATTAV
ncbi:hypothetical protein BOTBODRAFT_97245, partial [Botryobasidium botryosum FD-172 SS1]